MKRMLLGIVLMLALSVAVPALALAAPGNPVDSARDEVCQGLLGQAGGSCSTAQSTGLDGVLRGVLSVLSFIAGVAAVIMIVISGFKYITSSGDASNIASAKTTLIYAIVGLVVVALAQFIVRFVLSEV